MNQSTRTEHRSFWAQYFTCELISVYCLINAFCGTQKNHSKLCVTYRSLVYVIEFLVLRGVCTTLLPNFGSGASQGSSQCQKAPEIAGRPGGPCQQPTSGGRPPKPPDDSRRSASPGGATCWETPSRPLFSPSVCPAVRRLVLFGHAGLVAPRLEVPHLRAPDAQESQGLRPRG